MKQAHFYARIHWHDLVIWEQISSDHKQNTAIERKKEYCNLIDTRAYLNTFEIWKEKHTHTYRDLNEFSKKIFISLVFCCFDYANISKLLQKKSVPREKRLEKGEDVGLWNDISLN